jgi:hypothetical protein
VDDQAPKQEHMPANRHNRETPGQMPSGRREKSLLLRWKPCQMKASGRLGEERAADAYRRKRSSGGDADEKGGGSRGENSANCAKRMKRFL